MCQLTFINTNDMEFNRKILLNQFLVNTITTHQDGWGFFTKKKGVFKTQLEPWNTLNLGTAIRENVVDSEPILAHVRLATYTNTEKEVSDEKSHPFETKDFIVAHNGKLDGDIIKEERFKGMIDSEIFTHVLQETYDKFPKMAIEKLIDKAYKENFTGKFAFLIYFKPKERYYIIRGKTAALHKTDIFRGKDKKTSKKIGYIVNTEKADLMKAFKFSDKSAQLSIGEPYWRGEVEELEQETAYIVNTTYLRKLGEVKELNRIVARAEATAYNQSEYWKNNPHTRSYEPVVIPGSIEKFLLELHDTYGLSIPEIDRLFLEITGFSPIAAEKATFALFKELIEPFLKHHKTHKHNLWKNIVARVWNPLEAYNLYDIQFPYFINTVAELDSKWIAIRDERKLLAKGEDKTC